MEENHKMKVTWIKSQVYNSDFKEETAEYRGVKLVISFEEDSFLRKKYVDRVIRKKWYGRVYDSDGKLMKTVNGYNKYALTRFVVESRKMMVSIIDNNWGYYSGQELSKIEKQKANEEALTKRQYIIQNIHWYSECFGPNHQLDAENLHTVMTFALDNFEDFEKLFKLRKEFESIILDHNEKYNKWANLPYECRQERIFSHNETQIYSRMVRDRSSYWGYDELRTVTEYDDVPVYVSNPRYVKEPVIGNLYPRLKEIEDIKTHLSNKANQKG